MSKDSYFGIAQKILNMEIGYEINIDPKDVDKECMDEWGTAQMFLGEDRGIEYNLCYEDGECYSAFYPMYKNDDDTWDTDTSEFVHYEIDFENPNWKEHLYDAMVKAVVELEIMVK